MLATLGAVLGVVVALLVICGALWSWVVLPNLREQLLKPVAENRRQLTENRHQHRRPTVLDRLDDLEQTLVDVEQMLEGVALNQTAILAKLGDHIGESAQDRVALWLNVDRLHRRRKGRKHHVKKRGDTGGP